MEPSSDPSAGRPHGRLVAGRYRLEQVLGRGGMGVVWAARDELLGRSVAVKEVLTAPGLAPEQVAEARRRTVQEARTAARLSSPAAVLVFDAVEDHGEPWVVMERLAPRTLDDVLAERGRLPPDEVATLGLRLLDALDAAHAAGVLHRDLKPGNVMFRGEARVENAVLTDFGIARLLEDPTTTATGMLVGSPAFVAPERARGDRASPASDLWALGVTLWIAAEGVSPFAREGALQTLTAVLTADPPELRHAGPLASALTGLLAKDPAQRLDSERLRSLLEHAEAAARGPGVPARPVAPDVTRPVPVAHRPARAPDAPPLAFPAASAAPRDQPVRRRGRAPVVLALLAVVVAGALAVAVAALRGDRTPSRSTAGAPAATSGPPSAASGTTRPSSSSSSSPATSSATTTRTTTPPTTATRSASRSRTTAGPTSASVPAGMRRYADPSGFSLAVPTDWRTDRRGQRVYLRDPGSTTYLLVDQTTTPAADPLADWRAQERVVARRLPGYRLIRIDPVTVGAWRGADWEFTHGRGTHVLDRNLVTGPRQAYALYWSAPDSRWSQSLARFRQVMATFTPRS